jgi:predicted kinase
MLVICPRHAQELHFAAPEQVIWVRHAGFRGVSDQQFQSEVNRARSRGYVHQCQALGAAEYLEYSAVVIARRILNRQSDTLAPPASTQDTMP